MMLEVHSADPIAFTLQPLHHMAADEATCSVDENSLHPVTFV